MECDLDSSSAPAPGADTLRKGASGPFGSSLATNKLSPPVLATNMASYWHFIIMIIGGIETAWLGSLHTRGLIKWGAPLVIASTAR